MAATVILTAALLATSFQKVQVIENPANQTSPQEPCPYGLPRQNNGVCPIIPEQ
jgi:hypothetical protein